MSKLFCDLFEFARDRSVRMSSEADRAVSDFNHKSIEEKRRLSSAYRIEKIGIAEGGAVGQ